LIDPPLPLASCCVLLGDDVTQMRPNVFRSLLPTNVEQFFFFAAQLLVVAAAGVLGPSALLLS
jgi:hypothetical protein